MRQVVAMVFATETNLEVARAVTRIASPFHAGEIGKIAVRALRASCTQGEDPGTRAVVISFGPDIEVAPKGEE